MMKSKYKIIALFGKAGSGKDYILNQFMNNLEYNVDNFHKIIHSTTRPPRENEKEGEDYHFLTANEFLKKDYISHLLEFARFNKWWYGTPISSLKEDKINIGTFNLSALTQISFNPDITCLPIYITAFPKIRLIRQLNREKTPNCYEIVRRFLADEEDFKNIPIPFHIIENNYNETLPVIEEILDLSKKL